MSEINAALQARGERALRTLKTFEVVFVVLGILAAAGAVFVGWSNGYRGEAGWELNWIVVAYWAWGVGLLIGALWIGSICSAVSLALELLGVDATNV